MARRHIIVLASCGVLAGCSFGAPVSNFAFPKLPRVTIPDIHLMGVPLYGEKPSVPLTATTPYQLSSAERDVVRSAVTSSFPGTAALSFYPLRSGLTADGRVSVCGMVLTRGADGAADDRLFRGDLVRQPAPGTFSVRQISGANAATIEVYGDCQKQGLA
ncbi:hypothetical protein [Aurantimonas endophytica]|uniref:Lipoprotein n=1 Tax=Aurantimonas endophytica TaxID=1522175 RepID=A0A7W6MQ48_9HYPH|nr:hypothetical protein [Aurantimonas endophytica]MBB4003574.1 hypothetical protein [Aurantimonas endophytica]MCO6404432.1 hypothetical protein [Aurantimonas endophytica]